MKFYISAFFENPSRKFKCHYNLKEITGTLCEEQNKFLITSHSILFRMRNVSVKKRRENQNTHLMFNRIFFKNEIVCKNTKEPGRPRVTIWRMYIACWLQKAVPLQAWSGPEGSRKLRFPDFMITAQDGGKVVSLTHRPPLPPGNRPGTHFC